MNTLYINIHTVFQHRFTFSDAEKHKSGGFYEYAIEDEEQPLVIT
jgi:hypothetical protein